MDESMQPLVEMGVSLTELAVKGTASAVTKKIRAVKDIKDAEKLRTIYDALINEVLQEREEAVRIAQAYKSELERIVISDEDIEHLHNTVSNILEIFKNIQLAGVDPQDTLGVMRVQKQIETMEQVKNLISVDTLKTMQLLGFNYKAAIGEPLTQICSRAILSLTERKNTPVSSSGRKR
ncbi:MAG: hypothetical protein KH074_08315 [Faecalibacterium prausnitzii]|nr:hypothetical protein [Faecalibacterium prausnitzii]